MTNPYEAPNGKKEVLQTVDQKTGGFGLGKIDQAASDSNRETASMEAVGRENDLAKVREIEARFGLNTDKTEGVISAQIKKLKKAGRKIASIGMATMALSGIGGEIKSAQAEQLGSKGFNLSDFIKETVARAERQPQIVEEIRNDLINHIGSKEYLDKLEIEYNGSISKAKHAQELRVMMLRKVKINLVPKEEIVHMRKDRKGGADSVSGFYSPLENAIFVNSEEVAVGMPVAVHELLHASTKGEQYITDNTRNLLDESFVELGDGQDDYYRDSSERLTRKQQLDLDLERLGIKSYGEEFTDEHYEQMMDYYRQGVLSLNSMDFIKRTNPDYFKQIFNEVAMAEKPDLSGSADVIIEDEKSPAQKDTSDKEQEGKSEEFESRMKEVEAKGMEIKESLLQRIGSREYLERLKLELDGNEKEAQKNQLERIENLKQVKIEFLSLGQMKTLYGYDDPKGGRVVAFYDEKEHRISFAHDQEMDDLSDSMLHEFIHASMKQEKEMTPRAKEILSGSYQYLEGKSQKINEYLKGQNERMARKQQVDTEMEKLGVKKYGEEFTDEHYEKLKALYLGEKLSRNVKIFFETTKPADFKKIFNEIAKNEESPDLSVAA